MSVPADASVKLIKLRLPESSNSPDPRMNWTLADVQRMFPTGRYTVQFPLCFPKQGGVGP